ncbi:Uncharacterised protein [Chlamydia abortus]|nr:Uncharacterised protein [Chlamydia abortus]
MISLLLAGFNLLFNKLAKSLKQSKNDLLISASFAASTNAFLALSNNLVLGIFLRILDTNDFIDSNSLCSNLTLMVFCNHASIIVVNLLSASVEEIFSNKTSIILNNLF